MTAYADLPFAAFVTGATVLIGRALAGPDSRDLPLAGLLLGAACATKQEGMLWALALGIGVLLTLWRRMQKRTTGIARGAVAVALPALLFGSLSLAARRWILPHRSGRERYGVVLSLAALDNSARDPSRWRRSSFVSSPIGRSGVGLLIWSAWPVSTCRADRHLFWRATAHGVRRRPRHLRRDAESHALAPRHGLLLLLLQLFPLALLVLAEQVCAGGPVGASVCPILRPAGVVGVRLARRHLDHGAVRGRRPPGFRARARPQTARLASTEYWFNPDEGLYHRVATLSSADEARAMARGLAHPPMHYWILRPLARLGEDPRTLRLPLLLLLACWRSWPSGGWGASLAPRREEPPAGWPGPGSVPSSWR